MYAIQINLFGIGKISTAVRDYVMRVKETKSELFCCFTADDSEDWTLTCFVRRIKMSTSNWRNLEVVSLLDNPDTKMWLFCAHFIDLETRDERKYLTMIHAIHAAAVWLMVKSYAMSSSLNGKWRKKREWKNWHCFISMRCWCWPHSLVLWCYVWNWKFSKRKVFARIFKRKILSNWKSIFSSFHSLLLCVLV